ncbi:transcription factor grauzone [Drosophila grimshawi]|uniref:GH19827 n=1 Tax=Drosophila grimshawi TaxID=7222 RepID=B4J9W7_DROGR|nr:transcription factor grauzone [Drosophila grimshawi]EDW02554.1 GH19827 [Drosophila grimshawi]
MCFLCTQCTDDAVGIIQFGTPEAELLDINQIIEKHFWLRTKDVSGHICGTCWDQLYAFHKFYTNVEQAHEQLLLQSTTKEAETEANTTLKMEPAVQVQVNPNPVQQETGFAGDSVAAAVKRRRGRPRKQLPGKEAIVIDSNEFKAVLEQINLNEIKIEFPEADLSIADVLDDQEEQNITDYLEQSECESDAAAAITKSNKRKRTQKVKKHCKKLKVVSKVKSSGVRNIKKSQEFNDYIREHYKVHCSICNVPLGDFSEMLVHTRKEHNQRGFALCCNRKFWKRGILVDHLQRHQNPEFFKCHICQRVMGHRRSLEMHMRMHEVKQRGRLYQCEQCSKSFYSSIVCERHKLTHIPKEQWQVPCTNCSKTFPNEYLMQQHVKLVHLRKFDKICDVCGKAVRGRAGLARHMEEHAGVPQKTIKCHLCESTLTTKYGLARHIKMMHTAENLQPMQCEICLKISPSLQAHQHHIKYTHNTERTHQCPMCTKAFKRPNELREHLTTHTGEVLYTCPHCPKTFNSNANMHAHRKKMHFKEWQEHHLRHQARHRKTTDSIISVSVRKTTEKSAAATAAAVAAAASEEATAEIGLEC